MSRAARTLYRLLLRQAAAVEKEGLSKIDVQMPMDKMAWLQNGGGHGWATPAPAYTKESMQALLPWLPTSIYSGSFSADELRDCIRSEFRNPSSAPQNSSELLDRAFTSLKVLGEQIHMAECTSSATTNSIRIDVCTAFVGTQADLDPTYDPDDATSPPKLFYTYRVRISNTGEKTVQLRSRHWIIRNDQGKVVAEVARGARGVVGCTPILKPETAFEYFSGTDMNAPGGGTMEGSFEMALLNARGTPESSFDAEIAPFKFLPPNLEGGVERILD